MNFGQHQPITYDPAPKPSLWRRFVDYHRAMNQQARWERDQARQRIAMTGETFQVTGTRAPSRHAAPSRRSNKRRRTSVGISIPLPGPLSARFRLW